MPRKYKKPPAANYLTEILDPIKTGEKCEHKEPGGGMWLVSWGGKLYRFEYSTQMQKDCWLSSTKNRHQEALDSLRWFCFKCGTVQMP